ncbi:MAG: serine-type D-Ala-D-Ala carboxypeptidase [Methylobacter sp.]|nr:MAG: serine-type D-Ala-D-Ala carboxypeptidase [Methylobacter sp.]PPD04050.1 MAG: serine-type D-Ala-D-Ala carboxypeptidase [Methylobacter sp.]PPD23344.1 MAG: serine-type D-Ala-D-Ala carboxypeptidase [Methylobacter sp.]PPD34889.1 MAG: serine-type D-Ala-D-Ala carboxypeptidase [Methylomonas sp.]
MTIPFRLPGLALVFLLFFFAFQTANAVEAEILTPSAPSLSANAYILIDFNSGRVLAEKNADAKVAPASLTKIMTVYVVFKELASGRLHLEDKATISDKAWNTQGSRMFIEVNTQVSIQDLLHGVIIQSGNDASVALAEQVAGNEATFADVMNQHAARLGMANTHFVNSDGLPNPEHYSTARDLSILTRAMINEFPDYYRWFSQKEFTYNKITQQNRNKLLWRDPSVDGVKTGFTDDAGYCLVASALRNDMRLISVVMGTSSTNTRANENEALLNYGYRFFETHKLYQGQTALAEARVWQGHERSVPVGMEADFYVTIPRRRYNDLKATLNVDKNLVAPIAKSARLGNVHIVLDNDTIADKDLVALNAVDKGNIIERIYDQALRLIGK